MHPLQWLEALLEVKVFGLSLYYVTLAVAAIVAVSAGQKLWRELHPTAPPPPSPAAANPALKKDGH